MRTCWSAAAVAAAIFASPQARGGYVVDLESDGATELFVVPGTDSAIVNVDVVFDGELADRHNSAILRIISTTPGLELLSYSWHGAYAGSIFDDSKPAGAELPIVLTETTLSGLGYADGVVDFELSNVVPSGAFASGVAASFVFRVPETFTVGTSFTFAALPDTIANGFDIVDSQSGSALRVNVVPSPGVLALAVSACLLSVRRRGCTASLARASDT